MAGKGEGAAETLGSDSRIIRVSGLLAKYGGQTYATDVGNLFRREGPTGFLRYASCGPHGVKGRRGELAGRCAKASPGVGMERPCDAFNPDPVEVSQSPPEGDECVVKIEDVLGAVGRMAPAKGQELLCNVARRVRDAHLDGLRPDRILRFAQKN